MSFENILDDDGIIMPPVLRAPQGDVHKYDRGHGVVISGPALATGASRLSAQAALAVGAGLVTILGDEAALHEHATHLTAIMMKKWDGDPALLPGKVSAIAAGPGLGVGAGTGEKILSLLRLGTSIVLDADALTCFSGSTDILFAALHHRAILTPHEGEFRRLFPDILIENRTEAALMAAKYSGATLLLKGPQTILATASGRVAINRHASPWLATAGSGDVLTGMICGIMAQGVSPFDAGCIAARLHGDIGVKYGAGLTADLMVGQIPLVLHDHLAA